jgi:hypothetical protein
MDDIGPPERERVRRRDRKRITKMVVNGGNLRRQVQALRERAFRRTPSQTRPSKPLGGDVGDKS